MPSSDILGQHILLALYVVYLQGSTRPAVNFFAFPLLPSAICLLPVYPQSGYTTFVEFSNRVLKGSISADFWRFLTFFLIFFQFLPRNVKK